ncbi:MAG: hypothetical protein WBL61_17325 [Bryobacteraceae bacterium]
MFQSLVDTLFGCAHSRTTFPMTPGRRNGAGTGNNSTKLGTYVVCLDCGKEFAYDWRTMRVGNPVVAPVTAAPVVAEPVVAMRSAAPEAQPMYR